MKSGAQLLKQSTSFRSVRITRLNAFEIKMWDKDGLDRLGRVRSPSGANGSDIPFQSGLHVSSSLLDPGGCRTSFCFWLKPLTCSVTLDETLRLAAHAGPDFQKDSAATTGAVFSRELGSHPGIYKSSLNLIWKDLP